MLSKVSPIGLGSKLVVIYPPPQALPPPHQISHLFSPVHRPRQHPSLGKYSVPDHGAAEGGECVFPAPAYPSEVLLAQRCETLKLWVFEGYRLLFVQGFVSLFHPVESE